MNILVTGGAGLVGMALRARFSDGPDQAFATDATNYGRNDPGLAIAQLEDFEAMESLVRQHAITHIVHCGAISGPMLARDEPMVIVRSNILGTANLLEIARRAGIERFVFCSSVGTYGDVGTGVITEEAPLNPTSLYGASKVAGEHLLRAFGIQYGLKGVSLRPARIYGPYRRGNCYLGDMLRDSLAGRQTIIPCDPSFLYHYIHVDDVVDAIDLALKTPKLEHSEYNVAPAEVLTMPEIVARARQAVPGISVALVPGADDVADRQERFSIARIATDLGWKPRRDLVTGVADYARCMRQDAGH